MSQDWGGGVGGGLRWNVSKGKGYSDVENHIDSHTALLPDHYSEVVAMDDLSWPGAECG